MQQWQTLHPKYILHAHIICMHYIQKQSGSFFIQFQGHQGINCKQDRFKL